MAREPLAPKLQSDDELKKLAAAMVFYSGNLGTTTAPLELTASLAGCSTHAQLH